MRRGCVWRETPGAPRLLRVVGVLLVAALAEPAGSEQVGVTDLFTPVAGSRAELDAFRAVELETGLSERSDLIREFLSSFPDSELRYLVLRQQWRMIVSQRSRPEDVLAAARMGIDAAEEFLGARLHTEPDVDTPAYLNAALEFEDLRVNYYASMASAARRLGDVTLMAQVTDRAVESEQASWGVFQRMTPEGTRDFRNRETAHRIFMTRLLSDAMAIFRAEGRVDQVLEYGRRILDIDPYDSHTLIAMSSELASSTRGTGSPESLDMAMEYAFRAIESLTTDASVNPAHRGKLEASVRSTLGQLYDQLGDFAAAEAAYLLAIDGLPADALNYRHLADLYSRTGRSAEALSALGRAAYLDSEDPDTQALLEEQYQYMFGSLEGLDAFIREQSGALARPDESVVR